MKAANWEVALLLHVHLKLESGGFVAQLAMLLPENAITLKDRRNALGKGLFLYMGKTLLP